MQQKIQPKSEKDLKTSLNLGTKLQQNGFNNGHTVLGEKSVTSLTNKFDFRSKNIVTSETELKQIVNEQTKLISNLREQLEAKDKKIIELEKNVKILLENIPTTKLDLSLELNGHSLA